ncbi:MAG: RNA 2',3'-cyclic phosphodiesterase, partial [Anaerolineae bacterium]|nr:RNA 2',3'-cyclic phosphodiesterase [Anaerolineae bacterium]
GDTQNIVAIQSALETVQIADFTLQLRGVGTFPQRGKPRVLWVGVEVPKSLQALYAAVGQALQTTGFQPESRPYHPHLTLARFNQQVPDRNTMQAYLQRHAEFSTEAFAAAAVVLYESQLTPSGARYCVRSRIPLH